MIKFKIKIINHTVIGHPYIPICKFVLNVLRGQEQETSQSHFINPPVYDPNFKNENKISSQSESNYLKQFPVQFSQIQFRENDSLSINLIQLTKTGRQKQIGFSKILLNKQVLNKTTKHRIVQFDPKVASFKEQKFSKSQLKNVVSIIEVSIYNSKLLKQKNDNQTKEQQQRQGLKAPTPQQKQQMSIKSSQQQPQIIYQNKNISQDNSYLPFDKYDNQQSSHEVQNGFYSKKETSNNFNKKQSRQKIKGKIYKQLKTDNKVQTINSAGMNSKQSVREELSLGDKGRKKRRQKYIFNSNQISQQTKFKLHQSVIQPEEQTRNEKKQRLKQKSPIKTIISPALFQTKNKFRQAQPQQKSTQPIQYFVSNYETSEKGCNVLSGLNFVYEAKFGPFFPKYITFLTYDLYQKIIRINCQQYNKLSSLNHQSHEQQYEKFILQTNQGSLKIPEVCNVFSSIRLLLPKHCLILRIQLILMDESVYIGILNNQIGSKIKSTLNFKGRTHSQKNIPAQKQRINIVLNISEKEKSLLKPKLNENIVENPNSIQIHQKDFIAKSQEESQKNYKKQPMKHKLSKKAHTINDDDMEKYLNDKTQNKVRQKRISKMSSVQKTLNAISAYKIRLSPNQDNETYEFSEINNKGSQNRYQNIANEVTEKKLKNSFRRKSDKHLQKQIRQYDPHQSNANRYKSQIEENYINYKSDKVIKSLNKDLPKIILQRSKNTVIDGKKSALRNLREQNKLMITRKHLNVSADQKFSKDRIREEFIRKLLGKKYSPPKNANKSLHKLSNIGNEAVYFIKQNNSSVLKHLKDKTSKNKYRQLTLPSNGQLNQTTRMISGSKIGVKDPLIISKNRHLDCNLNSSIQIDKRVYLSKDVRCSRHHQHSDYRLDQRARNKTQIDDQKGQKKKKYLLKLNKIQYVKLVDENYPNNQTHIKINQSEAERDRTMLSLPPTEEYEIFLKVYSIGTKQKKQFVTESKRIQKAYEDTGVTVSMIKKHSSQLGISKCLACSWNLEYQDFIFAKIKQDSFIGVQAYGDLSQRDNNQFLGKCIFSVKEMLFLQLHNRITSYLVNNGKIQSHLALHFQLVL